MTLDDLKDHAWAAMPPLRKRLVGRRTVNDFVQLAVENWSGDYLAACAGNHERQVYASALLGQLKRCHQPISGREPQEYGFIWVLILQSVASAVIQWLIRWWLDRRANRALILVWQHELIK